jgi:predicted RNase H-like nuclease
MTLRLQIEPTDRIVEIEVPGGGMVPARVWQGVMEDGTDVALLVTRVAVHKDAAAETQARFAEALTEVAPARAVVLRAFDLRVIL